jgi:hypothetical protein
MYIKNAYNSLGRFHNSPPARVIIFILLNTLVEECTINLKDSTFISNALYITEI